MTMRSPTGFSGSMTNPSKSRPFRFVAVLAACAMALSVAPSARAQSCPGDLDDNGIINGADLGILLTNWGACGSFVESVSPSHGSVLGGGVITITGGRLAEASAVTIGGVPCTGVTVLTPTAVRAVTPAGVEGEAAIRVTTPAGTVLSPQAFLYVQQSVGSIQPNNGGYAGGTPITITGEYLAGTTGVTVGGVPATNVVNVNPTTVTAVTPPGSLGTVDVVVTGAKGTVTVAGGFTYFSVPSWATVVELIPDPAVVTDATMRAAIATSGRPWRVRDTATQIEMLLVPPGAFMMGCTASNGYGCVANESPRHAVTLTQAFYLGRYELTQAEWTATMGTNPAAFQGFSDSPSHPVEQVSWSAIQAYLAATGMRLPSEAEWEYACRAGTTTAYNNGSNDDLTAVAIAWYAQNSGSQTRAVGGKAANALGLHDMAGNVWEWVNDWSGTYSGSAQINPTGPASGGYRVLRGGGWPSNPPGYVRSSVRTSSGPYTQYYDAGFRVARNP